MIQSLVFSSSSPPYQLSPDEKQNREIVRGLPLKSGKRRKGNIIFNESPAVSCLVVFLQSFLPQAPSDPSCSMAREDKFVYLFAGRKEGTNERSEIVMRGGYLDSIVQDIEEEIRYCRVTSC